MPMSDALVEGFKAIAEGVYLEGLAVDQARNVIWYSDVIAGGIHGVTPEGEHRYSFNESRMWTGGVMINSDGAVLSTGQGGIMWNNPDTGRSGWLLKSNTASASAVGPSKSMERLARSLLRICLREARSRMQMFWSRSVMFVVRRSGGLLVPGGRGRKGNEMSSKIVIWPVTVNRAASVEHKLEKTSENQNFVDHIHTNTFNFLP